MPRARPYVVTARLNEEELDCYNFLLRSVAGVRYSRNKSRAFRELLIRVASRVREEGFMRARSSGSESFEPPVIHPGNTVEVSGPVEIEMLEEESSW